MNKTDRRLKKEQQGNATVDYYNLKDVKCINMIINVKECKVLYKK